MLSVQTSLMKPEELLQKCDEKNRRLPQVVGWESIGFRKGLPGEVLGKDGNDSVLRKDLELTQGAMVTGVPKELRGEMSVCGFKDFLIVEVRRFHFADGSHVDIDCAHTAALDIQDSPVHFHNGWENRALEPLAETYQIVRGEGEMVLGDSVIAVDPDEHSHVNIPPGVVHGLAAKHPGDSVIAVLQFRPSMAPAQEQTWGYRDEIVIPQMNTRKAIEQLRLKQ